MKADQERVRNLLIDTVGLLCRNGLAFQHELKVEGLLGITLDNNDVFLVNISQMFHGETSGVSTKTAAALHDAETSETSHPDSDGNDTNDEADRDISYSVKEEMRDEDDDDVYIVTKQEDISVKEEPCDIRVPPPHGPVVSDVESRSFDATNFSGMFPNDSDSGAGPPRKRRAIDFNALNVMNSPSTSVSVGGKSSMMVARGTSGSTGPGGGAQGGDPSFSLDAWTSSQLQGQPLDPAQAEQMLTALMVPQRNAMRKPGGGHLTCDFAGCNKRFYQTPHLYDHQRKAHGAGFRRHPMSD